MTSGCSGPGRAAGEPGQEGLALHQRFRQGSSRSRPRVHRPRKPGARCSTPERANSRSGAEAERPAQPVQQRRRPGVRPGRGRRRARAGRGCAARRGRAAGRAAGRGAGSRPGRCRRRRRTGWTRARPPSPRPCGLNSGVSTAPIGPAVDPAVGVAADLPVDGADVLAGAAADAVQDLLVAGAEDRRAAAVDDHDVHLLGPVDLALAARAARQAEVGRDRLAGAASRPAAGSARRGRRAAARSARRPPGRCAPAAATWTGGRCPRW